jgi:hypothetical protein
VSSREDTAPKRFEARNGYGGKMMRFRWQLLLVVSFFLSAARICDAAQSSRAQWLSLFDGKSLAGWKLVGGHGPGYVVRDGVLVCPADGGGNLETEREYSDFRFRFEFKLAAGGNNGVAIRAPREGDAAYVGMEVQILDDSSPLYKDLEAGQYHGSIYKVAAAKRGALQSVGKWNREEIEAIGRHIKVTVNGRVTVDADLNAVSDAAILFSHPGLRRERGIVGFCGHGPSEVQFRNIEIQDLSRPLPDNLAPPGFTALFNGRDLSGWKGLVADPPTRAKMTPEALNKAQQSATMEALKHWKAVDGAITYDGQNNNLCTARNYGDFEMLIDWKIEAGGDSGLYLRGSPQVQIWDRAEGSGGLFNNEKNPKNPTIKADTPVGQWNRFRILMIGERLSIYLNEQLVVDNVVMENYWERDKPIYPLGAIELQHHGAPLFFKNIYVREIPRTAK